MPFALRAGAEFFMPVTAALSSHRAVPLLEWFERRGIPSKAVGGTLRLIFLTLAIFAIGSIVIPATDWVAQVPTKFRKVRAALEPVFDLQASRPVHRPHRQPGAAHPGEPRADVTIEQPNSVLGLLITSAPHLLIQLFFSLLVIFFSSPAGRRCGRRRSSAAEASKAR